MNRNSVGDAFENRTYLSRVSSTTSSFRDLRKVLTFFGRRNFPYERRSRTRMEIDSKVVRQFPTVALPWSRQSVSPFVATRCAIRSAFFADCVTAWCFALQPLHRTLSEGFVRRTIPVSAPLRDVRIARISRACLSLATGGGVPIASRASARSLGRCIESVSCSRNRVSKNIQNVCGYICKDYPAVLRASRRLSKCHPVSITFEPPNASRSLGIRVRKRVRIVSRADSNATSNVVPYASPRNRAEDERRTLHSTSKPE